MKVLLLTEFFPNPAKPLFTGGVEARTFMIAQHLAQEMEVEVVCRRTKQLRRRIKKGGLTIYPCGPAARRTTASFFSIFGRLVFILASLRQGLRLDFDLVEGSNFISYLPAFFLGKIKKKPTVAWTADVLGLQWLTHFNLTGLFGYLLERAGLSRNWNGLIAMSGQTKKKLVKRGIREARVRVVYGGVGYQTLNQLKVKKFEKRTIICISRLVNYKRVEDLIQAFTKLQVEEDDLRLIIIGSGPEEKGLRKLVQKAFRG